MRYFTPELVVMGQSTDELVLAAQERLWEEAGNRYIAYLDSIRPQFPPGLRRLDTSYFLHDAIIRGMGRREQVFVIILQLDTPPQSILTLTYDLVDDPVIVKDVLPPELCGTGPSVEWQYNEIEMVPGEAPTWRESLLLSNGWELKVHFRDIQVEEVQAVLPAPRQGVTGVCFVLQGSAPG